MTLPLRTTGYVTIVLIAAVLSLVLLLGIRQYQLNHQYEQIISQSEKLIFQFATIKEHITESLLEERPMDFKSISDEIERLNADLTRLAENRLVPGEYKVSLVNQIDIPGIVLLLRRVEAEPGKRDLVTRLNRETRILGDRLMRFDRFIVSHVKSKLVIFQSIVIGALAIVIFLISSITAFWYRQLGIPVMELGAQLKEAALGRRNLVSAPEGCSEIDELASSVNELLQAQIKEKKDFQEMIVRACGLSSVGELSAGIALEINNLVNGIINYAQLLVDEVEHLEERKKERDLLGKLITDGERIGTIIEQLLFLTQSEQREETPVEIEHLVRTSLSFMERQLKNDGIRLSASFSPDLPPIRANSHELQLVFLNLLNNARRALNRRYPGRDDNKRLEILAELTSKDGRDWLRTSVTDWGTGMDPAWIPALLDPFSHPKVHKDIGSGLGLPVTRILVEKHGGAVTIESLPGDHTTVTVDLPVELRG